MITRSHALKLDLSGTIFQDYNKSSLLFFDIETTGFTAKNGFIYLIGAISWQDNSWICTQWFAESTNEEPDILKEFLSFAKKRTLLVHFNGERFDIPFINEKCNHYHLNTSLSTINSRDLYRMIRPLRKFLGLDSLKQRSLEEFMGISRKDPFTGGELIKEYEKYINTPDKILLDELLLHNLEDLIGLACILPILSYQTIPGMNFSILNYEVMGNRLHIHARLPLSVPKRIVYDTETYILTAEGEWLNIDVKGKREPLKYFFKDYKNYYYLPKEDVALHKTVAAYVDKEYREPAKASNCYSKKNGYFLPQPEAFYSPVFKTDYDSKILYFMCKEAFLENQHNIAEYVSLLLSDIS